MAKRGGFGGGMMPGNINQLMKQAQAILYMLFLQKILS